MIAAAAVLALAAFTAVPANAAMKVTSPDFKPNGKIGEEQVAGVFGCTGKNMSPALSWSGAPSGTKSFAVTVYDPDAPTGSGFWHWQIYDLPPTTTSLPKNAGDPKSDVAPAGSIQGKSDFGVPGYGGPCPPPGKPHHYHFTVYALDVDKIPLPDPAPSAAVVGFMIHAHTIGKPATVTGIYSR
jgi:Raf kinase inhibitor-like YbhB/YbcL family protein